MERKITPKVLSTEHAQYLQASWTGQNESGWVPFGDALIVLPDAAAETAGSLGLIHLADDQIERNALAAESGVVVALGDDAYADIREGSAKPLPGMRVLFTRYAGRVFKGLDGRHYRVMTQECIAAGLPGSEILEELTDSDTEALDAGILNGVTEGTTVDQVTREPLGYNTEEAAALEGAGQLVGGAV